MPPQSANRDEEYDAIVVGAGVAGSILAARVAQCVVNPRNGEKVGKQKGLTL
jgi:pyruvate/2-oxoglutarate dehydrogenase complex dihydrolipoamide dehydrogenase (E3) component